jgi:hypothetical protein
MNNLQKSLQKSVVNEELMFQMILNKSSHKEPFMKKERTLVKNLILGVGILSLVTFGWAYDKAVLPAIKATFAVVSIDINPSFAIMVDTENKVVEVKAVNADAESMLVSDLVGLDINMAIETIILRAEVAGFINPVDTIEDYVVVTTAPLQDKYDKDCSDLAKYIEDSLNQPGLSDDVNVAVIKATLKDWLASQDKNIPLGLYIINGLVNSDGTIMSVSDFMKESKNLTLLQSISTLISRAQFTLSTQISKFLDKLEALGIDVSAYRARLLASGENLLALKDEVLVLWASNTSDTHTGSTVASGGTGTGTDTTTGSTVASGGTGTGTDTTTGSTVASGGTGTGTDTTTGSTVASGGTGTGTDTTTGSTVSGDDEEDDSGSITVEIRYYLTKLDALSYDTRAFYVQLNAGTNLKGLKHTVETVYEKLKGDVEDEGEDD